MPQVHSWLKAPVPKSSPKILPKLYSLWFLVLLFFPFFCFCFSIPSSFQPINYSPLHNLGIHPYFSPPPLSSISDSAPFSSMNDEWWVELAYLAPLGRRHRSLDWGEKEGEEVVEITNAYNVWSFPLFSLHSKILTYYLFRVGYMEGLWENICGEL